MSFTLTLIFWENTAILSLGKRLSCHHQSRKDKERKAAKREKRNSVGLANYTLKKRKLLCHSSKMYFLIGLMKNYGFILKPDVFSLLQSKCHYLWIKLKETLLLKWYFHFKPNVFLSRDHVTSRQTALFDVEVRHCCFLASSADRKSGRTLPDGGTTPLCLYTASSAPLYSFLMLTVL